MVLTTNHYAIRYVVRPENSRRSLKQSQLGHLQFPAPQVVPVFYREFSLADRDIFFPLIGCFDYCGLVVRLSVEKRSH